MTTSPRRVRTIALPRTGRRWLKYRPEAEVLERRALLAITQQSVDLNASLRQDLNHPAETYNFMDFQTSPTPTPVSVSKGSSVPGASYTLSASSRVNPPAGGLQTGVVDLSGTSTYVLGGSANVLTDAQWAIAFTADKDGAFLITYDVTSVPLGILDQIGSDGIRFTDLAVVSWLD